MKDIDLSDSSTVHSICNTGLLSGMLKSKTVPILPREQVLERESERAQKVPAILHTMEHDGLKDKDTKSEREVIYKDHMIRMMDLAMSNRFGLPAILAPDGQNDGGLAPGPDPHSTEAWRTLMMQYVVSDRPML